GFLDDNDGAARLALRLCPVRGQLVAVGSGKLDHLAHVTSFGMVEARIAIMKKPPQALFRMACTALERAGAHREMAEAAARHLVRAEAQGLATHGMSRVPFYCAMLRNGRADGTARPAMTSERA